MANKHFEKAGYGIAETGLTASEVLIRLYLLIFYTDIVGLEPKLAGYAAAIAIVWDAIIDPLMGNISDRTRSRFGRRRPYIAVGAVLLAASLIYLFSPPDIGTQSGKFWFLLLSYMLVNTATTVIAIPHAALGSELTPDRSEVTEIYAWRLIAGNLGAILGTIVPGIILTRIAAMPGNQEAASKAGAHASASAVVAAVILITASITFFATKRADKPTTQIGNSQVRTPDSKPASQPPQGHFHGLKSMLQNKPFLILFIAYLIATIGVNINSSFAFFYYKYRLQLTEADTQKVIAFFMVVFTLALIGWIALANRYGKKIPLFAGTMLLGIMTAIGYPIFPAGSLAGPAIAAIFGGLFVGSILLLDAWLVDVIDYDEVKTRQSRPGLYFGIWKMGSKAARAIAVALSGIILSAIDFQPNAAQSPEVSWRLALVFGPGVAVFFILGALLTLGIKLDEPRIAKVRQILAKRETKLFVNSRR